MSWAEEFRMLLNLFGLAKPNKYTCLSPVKEDTVTVYVCIYVCDGAIPHFWAASWDKMEKIPLR